MKKYILSFIILLLAGVNAAWAQVAKIGTTEYATLQAAFDAGADQTITLLTDVTIPAEIEISNGSSYTLDMNGCNITTSSCSAFKVAHGTLNITGNGTISGTPSNYKLIYLMGTTASSYSDRNYSNLTIGENVTVTCTNGYAVMISANANHAFGVNVTVDGTVEGLYGGLYINGSIQDTSGYVPKFVVNSTATVKNLSTNFSSNDGFYAIYAAGYANWTINGGDIYGGMELKSGVLNVSGGTFTGLGEEAHTPNGSATSTSGYALSVVNNSGYAGYPAVEITGGTFVGPVNIVDDDTDATNNTAEINIKGGTFSESVPQDFIDPNSNLTQNGNNQYVVAKSMLYEAFNAQGVSQGQFTDSDGADGAVVAAGEGGTVKLIHDVVGNVFIPANISFTFDLNGHTITNMSGSGITLASSYNTPRTVTVIDSDPEGKGAVIINKKYIGDGCISDSSGSSVVINGGTYTSDAKALYISSAQGWTINGGTFNGIIDAKSALTINDGTFTGEVYANNGYATTGSVTITGGTFSGDPNLRTANTDNIIAVSGGTFSQPVSQDFCATGYVPATADGGMYTVVLGNYVAKIGTTPYETLAAAFAAVQGGETITLLTDIPLTDRLFVNAGANPSYGGSNNRYATTTENKSITLDMNGHNITSSSNIALAGGSLTITNSGTISTTAAGLAPIEVRGTGDLTAKRTLTIGADVTLSGPTYGLNVFGSNDAQKNTIDVTVDGTVNGILFVLGNLSNAENAINIVVNGTVDASNAATGDAAKTGIALNGNANVTVNDNASVKGESGIEVRAGNLTVNGGTITGTATSYSYTANGSGTTTMGAAIAVAQHTTNPVPLINVTISGGTLEGTKQIAVTDVNSNKLAGVTVKVSDLILGPNAVTVLPDGYFWKSNGDGTSSPALAVAQIGTKKYATLEDAFAAATNGQTITLLADISLTNRLFVNAGANPSYGGSNNRFATTTENKSITLNLNGHNIESSSNIALAGGSLNITNSGTDHGVISTTNAGLAPIEVRGTGNLTQKRTLTVGTGVTLTGAEYGLNIFGSNDAQKNIIDVNVDGTVNGMLFVLGNLKNTANEININVAGTVDASGVTGTDEQVHTGIAVCGNASVHIIDGATVKGESGIEVRAGQLIMDGDVGGTITATADAYSYTANGSGTTVKGAAIAVSQHGTVLPTSATILGGTLTGQKLIAVVDAQGNNLSGVTVIAKDSYITNTETLLPDGYIWVSNGDGTSSPAPEDDAVAQIGNTKYNDLATAMAAVQDGETITILKNITLTDRLFVNAGATPAYAGTNNRYATTSENKSFTLDMNGKNITSSSNIALAGGSLNITNSGTADATHGVISTTADGLAPIEVRGTGDLTSKRTLTVGTGVTLSGAEYGLNIFGSNDAQKNLIDVNVDGTVNGMLFVLGNLKNTANEININVAGTVDASGVTGTEEKVHTGIALCGNATVTVNDNAKVIGESGIEVRDGKLNVNNGSSITATVADYSYTANGNGTTTKGAAIAVAQYDANRIINVTIAENCEYGGAKLIAVKEVNDNVTVKVADNLLSNADTQLPDGYCWKSNGDGTSSPALAVAQIGTTKYATLEDAFAAVQDGQTIKLLDDISLTDRLFVNAGVNPAYAGTNNRFATTTENKSITLDMNGHNITSSSNIALAGGSLNITNSGTADATHGVISTSVAGLAPIEIRGTGDLTQKRTLTVGTGVTLSGAEYGLNIFGSNDAQKNIIDVNVNGTVNGMLFVLGNLKNTANEININVAGTVDASGVTGTEEKVHTGIALNGYANVTVNNGASVTGESGIEVRAGNLTVNGGTITATSPDYGYEGNGNGTTTKGAAIAVAQHGTVLPVVVQLNGGTLDGTELIGVTDVNDNDLEGVYVIAKARFVENTETKLPDGLIWVNNGNGTYSIGVAPVQIIHDDSSVDSYATLAEAFSDVTANETIKLMADVALTDDVTLDESFKLDFNNHAINLNGHTIKLVQGATIKTNKQTNIFTAADDDYIITMEDSNDPNFPYAYSEKININTANFTVTVAPITYDGLNHRIDGQNPVKVKIYDVVDGDELDPAKFEITMLPFTSYDEADFNNREEDVYKDAYTYINAITIKGKPDVGYAGSITVDFVINPRDINDAVIEGNSVEYDASGYDQDAIVEIFRDNDKFYLSTYDEYQGDYVKIPIEVSDDVNDIHNHDVECLVVLNTTDYQYPLKDPMTYREAITLKAVEGGNFTGTRKVDFIIGGAKDIATSNITATVVYNGVQQLPEGDVTVIVKDGSTNEVLELGTDYELEYLDTYDYKNAQTYGSAVTIRGMGDYYNTKVVDYIITPKDINECTINASTPFTGSVIDPADVVTVQDGTTPLVVNTDYTLTVSNGYTYHDPQTYTGALTITGTGNYTGTVIKDFTITNDAGAIDITEIGMVESYVKFTGKNQPPSRGRLIVSVKNPTTGEKKTLVYEQDYTFTFNGVAADYYDAKTYSHAVTITGIGNYYGSFTADYVISPRELTERYIVCEAVDPLVWTGTELKLNVNNQISGRTDNNVILKLVNTEADPANNIPEDAYMLSSARDYTYTTEPVTMKDPGEYVVTFTGRYNFTGKRTVTVKVTKDINLLADDGIEIPVQILGSVTPNIRPSNIQDMVVTDGDNVLEQGTHYTLTFTDGTTTYQGGAGPYITQQGKYTAIITGKDPYYSGEKRKDFVVVNEYYTYNAPETGKEFAVHITSGKNMTATVGAKTGAAIVTESTSLTLPSTIGVTVPNATTPETFTLNSIENGAFAGCDNLRYIDATALENFTPSSLQRNIAASPFSGVPKQALVYLPGTTFTGENYVYKPGDGDTYYCEKFKIYDDLSGSQTSFDVNGNDYKWAYENIHPFMAYTIENTRMLTAGKHYTTCLPYDLAIPADMKAYTLDATSTQLFGFNEVPGTTLSAFTPYVLIPSKSGQQLSTVTTTVPVFPDAGTTDATQLNSTTKGNFTLYGTMRYMDGTDAKDKYIMQYKDGKSTWLSIDANDAGYTNQDERACILPMRAYIAPRTGSGARSYTATFTDIDGKQLTSDMLLDADDSMYYDLQGRKVDTPQRKGLYIKSSVDGKNGRKVIKRR
jgi:23S rRNA A1618 N6-methylase RlmF